MDGAVTAGAPSVCPSMLTHTLATESASSVCTAMFHLQVDRLEVLRVNGPKSCSQPLMAKCGSQVSQLPLPPTVGLV